MLNDDFKLCFIPPYSLPLASVELAFGILKRKFTSKSKNKSINLYNYEGYNHIVKWMKDFNDRTIRNCFLHFYKGLKDNISGFSLDNKSLKKYIQYSSLK